MDNAVPKCRATVWASYNVVYSSVKTDRCAVFNLTASSSQIDCVKVVVARPRPHLKAALAVPVSVALLEACLNAAYTLRTKARYSEESYHAGKVHVH